MGNVTLYSLIYSRTISLPPSISKEWHGFPLLETRRYEFVERGLPFWVESDKTDRGKEEKKKTEIKYIIDLQREN